MNRSKTFTASILGILFNLGGIVTNAVGAIIMIYALLLGTGVIEGENPLESIGADAGKATIAIVAILLVFFVLFIIGHFISAILSIVTATSAKKTAEVYAKRKKAIIANIVFNFLVAIPSMLVGVVLFLSLVGAIWFVIGIVLLIASILLILDLKKESTRVTQQNIAHLAQSVDAIKEAVEKQNQKEEV